MLQRVGEHKMSEGAEADMEYLVSRGNGPSGRDIGRSGRPSAPAQALTAEQEAQTLSYIEDRAH